MIAGARGNVLTTIDRNVVKAIFFKPLELPSLSAYVRSLAR